jgi:RNA dependent RNA polymerase
MLLKSHGVPDDVFLDMQRKMLHDLDLLFTDPLVAPDMISWLSGPDHEQRTRLMNVLKCGLEVGKDPFLFACSLAIRSHQLLGLRKKGRIFVNEGAALMGGLDVTKLLPEGCVFVQVRRSRRYNLNPESTASEQFEPIVGPVMVTKHPVMHPGDVRMLLAIDVAELRNHKNVILFSQLGDRPEADKMGGSDLDGDEFAVTWDSRLFLGEWHKCSRDEFGRFTSSRGRVLHRANIHEDSRLIQIGNTDPMSYVNSAVAPTINGIDVSRIGGLEEFFRQWGLGVPMGDRPDGATVSESLPGQSGSRVNDESLVDHFISFAVNDKLGAIGMLWQDWASKKGANCKECLLLAREHSIAVDFAKSGISADIPNDAKWKGSHAHWREKKDEIASYHCDSIVGRLYDQVVDANSGLSFESFDVAIAGRSLDRYGQVRSMLSDESLLAEALHNVYDPLVPIRLGWCFTDDGRHEMDLQEYLLGIAAEHRSSYEDQVMQVMNKYELRNEGELATGCIRKYQSLNKNRQHEVAEEVRRHGRDIYRSHRTTFFHHVYLIAMACRTVMGNDQLSDVVMDDSQLDLEEEVTQEYLDWTTDVTTRKSVAVPDVFSQEWMVRTISQRLAAAYYLTTYSPSRETHKGILLFGFPWIVSDVMACGFGSAE